MVNPAGTDVSTLEKKSDLGVDFLTDLGLRAPEALSSRKNAHSLRSYSTQIQEPPAEVGYFLGAALPRRMMLIAHTRPLAHTRCGQALHLVRLRAGCR